MSGRLRLTRSIFDVKQVGRELGVRYVLEGSVRKAANRVRITGQLIDAEDGSHLWAERYDRDLTDVFALQDEITISVIAAIEPNVRRAEGPVGHCCPRRQGYRAGLEGPAELVPRRHG